MVSFWPWKGDASSPASFEKTLSSLSKKIAATQLQLDKVRASSRRARVLWTLYLSFAYLVYAIVVLLVVGWRHLGALEWTGVAGGPVAIYLVRALSASYFAFRADGLEAALRAHHAQRNATIQKLKDATRYDSTQELLEKYGGGGGDKGGRAGGKKDNNNEDEEKTKAKTRPQSSGPSHRSPSGRLNLPPPPTANIQRPSSAPGTPGTPHSHQGSPSPQPHQQHLSPFAPPLQPPPFLGGGAGAEFAPNAGADGPPPHLQFEYSNAAPGPPRWFDRVFDLILGEDETAAKNRIVLLCRGCRMVNGQAPPGTKSLAEVGLWRCMSCGAENGELDEGRKIVRELMKKNNNNNNRRRDISEEESSDVVKVQQYETDEGDDSGSEEIKAGAKAAAASPKIKKRPGKGRKASQTGWECRD